MAQVLLHGNLHVTIYEIDKLHIHGVSKFFHKVVDGVESAVGIKNATGDLYATIDLENARVGRTRLIEKDENPHWFESFHIYCAHMASKIAFTIKIDNSIGTETLGKSVIPVSDLIEGDEVDAWLPIFHENHRFLHGHPKLHVKLHYFDVTRERSKGLKSKNFSGVPFTYFQQRSGCKVTLYQDAHVPDGFMPKIPLCDGKYYEPNRCWEDIFDAIMNAKHLIYITGWSVYTEIALVRDARRPKAGGDMTLGQLLKKKASEGVRVLMLVWDDRTSVNLLRKGGCMATHDEDTKNYFRDTDVNCVLCPRNPDDGRSLGQNVEISTMFTHHQKIVVVDSAMPNEHSQKRRIVSFIGGIDLCDGRYDTQFHSLFRTLDTVHHDDFHQGNIEGATIKKGGPREPWHDIHCRLEGPVAWDVLHNFEQRWRKQSGKDMLLPLQDLDNIITPPSEVHYPDDRETWNVQLFRSIDGGAAFGLPDKPEEAAKYGLVSGKETIIDRSIQDGYIHAIRRADKFIYIENQYFLGSSFAWRNSNDIKVSDVGCLQLIPKELSLKIVSKIEADQPFRVYVVIPMWPEGFPESPSVQAILDWQRRTKEMMYTDIVEALEVKGINADPKDYLTFFCLGNREIKKSGEYEPSERPDSGNYCRAQEARRTMIYVHSKMMIVDDEYIIIGSANINQRSMDGARDTEIAMGAYQPYHLSCKQSGRGQVHGFRMALWYEHIGMLDNSFIHPESMECIQKVNRIAERNWEHYTSDVLERDLPGHLLSYPIGVSSDGKVIELPGTENFPDTNARVLGSVSVNLPQIKNVSIYLPPILTT